MVFYCRYFWLKQKSVLAFCAYDFEFELTLILILNRNRSIIDWLCASLFLWTSTGLVSSSGVYRMVAQLNSSVCVHVVGIGLWWCYRASVCAIGYKQVCLSQTRTNLLYSVFKCLITNRLILSVAHDSTDRNRRQHVAVQSLISRTTWPTSQTGGSPWMPALGGPATFQTKSDARVADGRIQPAQYCTCRSNSRE